MRLVAEKNLKEGDRPSFFAEMYPRPLAMTHPEVTMESWRRDSCSIAMQLCRGGSLFPPQNPS